jgi:nucleoside-diphosphate-sugar epimerase
MKYFNLELSQPVLQSGCDRQSYQREEAKQLTVLITGGTGFVGINLSEVLTDEGLDVVLFARTSLPEEAKQSLDRRKGNYYLVSSDILNGNDLDNIIKKYGVTSIVHAAVITPDLDRERSESKNIMQVNLMGSVEILEAARRNNIEKLIYLSSGSIYGEAAFDDHWLSEEKTYPRPVSLYAISKYAGERTALRYKELFDMNIVVARVGTVFGPWEHYTGVRDTLSPPFLVTRLAVLGEEAILSNPISKDWVYSKDIAQALSALLLSKNLKHDVYHLSSGVIWSVLDWCEKLAIEFPDFRYKIANSNEKANIQYFGDRSPIAINRMIEDIGYVPQYGLEESFTDYMKWIKGTSEFWTL